MTTTKAPIESKTWAATLGAGAGTILNSFVLWVLGVVFWHVSTAADQAVAAASAVPAPVAGLLELVLAVGGAFIGGYNAPHTARTDVVPPDPPGPGEVVNEPVAPVVVPQENGPVAL